MSKYIVDCQTGATIERELNANELKQQTKDEAEYLAQESIINAGLQTRAAAKAAAQAKLAALGLTVFDLEALGL